MPTASHARRCARLLAAYAAALGCAGCVYLLQPQSYTQFTERATLQGDQYLGKELRTGLPEAIFLRWFTRTPDWGDPLRPYILGSSQDGAATVYRVGSGHRTISRVRFENGALFDWTVWLWNEDGLVAYVSEGRAGGDPLSAAARSWIETLDPLSEPLEPEVRPDRERPCMFRPGDKVLAVEELVRTGPPELVKQKGEWLVPARMAGGTRRPVLGRVPAGTRLEVRHRLPVWRLHAGGTLLDAAQDREYLVGSWAGLCPAGRGVPAGSVGVLTRDMVVVLEEPAPPRKTARVGYVPAFERVPIWLRRIGRLPAGTPEMVREWSPCGDLSATIEPADDVDGGRMGPIRVKVAPAGLFLPRAPSDGGDGVRPPPAEQPPEREDEGPGEQADRA